MANYYLYNCNLILGGVYVSGTEWDDPVSLPSPVVARAVKIICRYPMDLGPGYVYAIRELEVGKPAYAGNNIGDLRKLPDGTPITQLSAKTVTAAPGVDGVPAGVFYMEEPERFAGIRVASATPVAVSNRVTVSGTLGTTPGGERYINATSVVVEPGDPLPPLGTNTRALAEAVMEGLFIKTAGTVRSVGLTSFTIADGYFEGGVEVQTTVMTSFLPGVNVNDFVTVLGVASTEGSRIILRVP
jgi:hypothetical protein